MKKNIRTIPLKHKDFQSAMNKQIEKAKSALDVSLNPNDPALINQVTLGDQWDNPSVLAEALDMQPMYYARWATLLRSLKRERDKLKQRYEVWESSVKEKLTKSIYEANVGKGQTPSNAKPSQQSVTDRFNIVYAGRSQKYSEFHDQYLEYYNPIEEIEEKIDTVEVVVKAFEMRANTLISLSHLVRTMIEKGLVVVKLSSKRKSP